MSRHGEQRPQVRRRRLLGTVALVMGIGAASLAGTVAFAGANATPAPAASTSAPGRFVITDQVVTYERDSVVTHQDQLTARVRAHQKRVTALKRMRPAGSAQRYAALSVLKRGWHDKEFTCLVALWGHESGWRTHAGSSGGAYGIPQAYPGTKMGAGGGDWENDAHVQIRWGLGYIVGRYGTPCGAWSHWQGARSY